MGNYPESIELLKKAISLNSKTIREWAKEEKIFEKLHDNEQFRKLVKLKRIFFLTASSRSKPTLYFGPDNHAS